MTKLSAEQQKKGRDRFLANHPKVQEKILAISPAVAEALGVSLEELQVIEVMKAVETAAAAIGEPSHDYFLRFVADSEEQRQQWIEENRQEIKKIIGG